MQLYSFWLIFVVSESVSQIELTPIVGGKIVKSSNGLTKYSYMVSLQEMNLRQVHDISLEPCAANKQFEEIVYQHFCGGSLVNSYWVLTAAHCLWRKSLDRIIAIIGYENISFMDALKNYSAKRVEYIYFEPTNYQNDIALLRLQKPHSRPGIELAHGFGKLPTYGMKVKVKKSCKIIGYGAKQHAGKIQNNLFEGEVHIISKQQCRRALGYIWAPQNGENTLCALGNNQDTCQGDSGGPLICDYNGVNYIYGIVSHGLTCGISGIPSIYTLTIPYVEWINLVIQG